MVVLQFCSTHGLLACPLFLKTGGHVYMPRFPGSYGSCNHGHIPSFIPELQRAQVCSCSVPEYFRPSSTTPAVWLLRQTDNLMGTMCCRVSQIESQVTCGMPIGCTHQACMTSPS